MTSDVTGASVRYCLACYGCTLIPRPGEYFCLYRLKFEAVCRLTLASLVPRNDLLCVEWDVKLHSVTQSLTHFS